MSCCLEGIVRVGLGDSSDCLRAIGIDRIGSHSSIPDFNVAPGCIGGQIFPRVRMRNQHWMVYVGYGTIPVTLGTGSGMI